MGMDPFGGGAMFSIVPVIVVLGFIFVIGMIIVQGLKGGAQWARNNNSLVLTVVAKVVAKRTDIRNNSHIGHANHVAPAMHHHHSTTRYFATFEFESGDRLELGLSDKEFGLLAEGDVGKLTFQGTRYQGFTRNSSESSWAQ